MKTTKRLLACMLSLIMLVSLLAGCGTDTQPTEGSKATEAPTSADADEATDAPTEAPTEEAFDARSITEGVKLTIAVQSNAKVEDFNTNAMTLQIEEKLGVDLEFMEIPSSDYSSKLNVMVMGGEKLPDIIFNPGSYTQWISEGALVELSDYYADPNFSANIRAAEERAGRDIVSYLLRPEGTIYALPKLHEELYTAVKQKMWVYQPWLDALNLEVPKTMEEFYEACKLVCANDMNGNGKKDEIGVSGRAVGWWFDPMMSSFVYAHEASWRTVENGKVGFAYTTDEWKEGLKYIKKFFDEGLIPKETLTQSGDQYQATLFAEECVAFSFSNWNYTGTDQQRRREYTVMPALEGPNGVGYSCYMPVVTSAGAVITTDCENPDAAFLVMDYMCSVEMSIANRYGQQGVDWDYWEDAKAKNNYDESQFVSTFEGYEISLYAYDMIGFWDNPNAQNVSYRQAGPYILDTTLTGGVGVWIGSDDPAAKESAELELITASAALACYDYIPDEVFDYAPLTEDETEQTADIGSALLGYVEEMTAAFLTGEKDIDAEWDNYLNELKKIGIEEYQAVLQTAYDRVH